MILNSIDSSEPIGRGRIARILQMGERATLTLIKHLRKEGIIETTKFGCMLTDFGKNIFTDSRFQRQLASEL